MVTTPFRFIYIAPTDLRTDVMWWDYIGEETCLLELTMCFNTLFKEAAERMLAKDLELVTNLKAGYRTKLITIEVGSQSLPNLEVVFLIEG